MNYARRQIIAMQKQLAEDLKKQIYGQVMDIPRDQRAYFLEYKKLFKRPFAITDKAHLLRAIQQADIIYTGDYHTLGQSQKSLQRVLREVLPGKRPVAIALEMTRSVHQPAIDRYLSERGGEGRFLRDIDYLRTWGFNWANYRGFFESAKQYGFPILGLNSSPTADGGRPTRRNLEMRDFHAASLLTQYLVANPERRIFCLFGDLHVAGGHLPRQVARMLAMFGEYRRHLIIYQNSETVYWKLADLELDSQVDVVQFSRNEFCIQNTVPVAKWQSFLSWEEHRQHYSLQFRSQWDPDNELESPANAADWSGADEDIEVADRSEQVADLARRIARFFEIPDLDVNNLAVYTPEHLDFLKDLKALGIYKAAALRHIASRVRRHESFFLPETGIIYLASLSVNRAAEMATLFVHQQTSGSQAAGERKADFYVRAVQACVGYFGSLLINHKRMCYKDADFRQLLENAGRIDAYTRRLRRVGEWILKHRALESRHAAAGARPRRDHPIYHQPPDIHVEICRHLGYSLGDTLYHAMVQGKISQQHMRMLMFVRLDSESTAFETYMTLRGMAGSARETFASKRERL